MSERRVDPFTGRGVIIAPGRRGLGAAKPGGLPPIAGRCPFCPGHEADTEASVAAWPSEAAWQVRVVANKFPVSEPGAHEVGVDAREHDVDLADLSLEHATAMLRLYRDRMAALEARDGARTSLLFRNRGRRAGSSQPHPHTQMVALAWTPAEVALRWEVAQAFHAAHGESVHAAALREELEAGTRVLREEPRAVLFCPRAPTRPFEMRLMLREPSARFSGASDADLEAVAALLVDAFRRLRDRASVPDSNLVLRQPPIAARGPAAAWHLELLPRTGGDAGFELSSGEMIVVVSPEESADRLRAAPP